MGYSEGLGFLNMKSEAGTALYFDAAEFALEFLMSDYEYLDGLINEDGCDYTV